MKSGLLKIVLAIAGIGLAVGQRTMAQPEDMRPSVTQSRMSLALAYLQVDEGASFASLGSAILTNESEFLLSPSVKGRLEASLIRRSGSSNYYRHNEFSSLTDLYITEAVMAWQATTWGSIQGGIIDQDAFDVPNIISGEAFPGLKEGAAFHGDIISFSLEAQQSIPGSNYTRRREETAADGAARFFYERASLKLSFHQAFDVEFRASHFLFENLGPDVALTSYYQGNTVNGRGDSAAFATPFRGYEATVKTSLALSHQARLFARLTTSENLEAEEGTNHGSYSEAGFLFDHDGVKSSLSAGSFETGADLSPASYNASSLGHNNRRGYFVKSRISPPSTPFYGELKYTYAKELDDHPAQDTFEYVAAELGVQFAL